MTDSEALDLLTLLHKYVTSYAPDIPQNIDALADDLATSLDGRVAPADKPARLRDEIFAALLAS